MEEVKYGTLIGKDIKIHRKYFNEMVKLIGVQVVFRAPKADKSYDGYGELNTAYEAPILVGCIFEEHPDQQTLKKMGWVAELSENSSIIHLPYDLKGLEQGALVTVPSGLDDGKGRVFRIIKLSTGMIYPASITCEIAPEWEDNFDKALFSHKDDNFNLLNNEEEVDLLNEE